MVEKIWIGLDVSKKTFNAAMDLDRDIDTKNISVCRRFENNDDGVIKFMEWIEDNAEKIADRKVCILMEATGIYSKNLHASILRQNENAYVSVINPRKTKRYLDSEELGNKTDEMDAKGLARYGTVKHPQRTDFLPPEYEQLRDLVRSRDNMVTMRDMLANRSEERDENSKVISIEKKVHSKICKAIEDLEIEITAVLNKYPHLKRIYDIIVSFPGMGFVTAVTFMSELGPMDARRSRSEFSRFTGLAPVIKESGESVRGSHIAKTGSALLRKVLYMSSLHAIKKDPMLQAFHDRLEHKGKKKLTVKCACMRKILLMLRAMVMNDQMYDANKYKEQIVKKQKIS